MRPGGAPDYQIAGCGIGCRYCDTPLALRRPGHFPLPGGGQAENPVGVDRLADLIQGLEADCPGAQALAVTGGEPLEQAAFLGALLSLLRKRVLLGKPVLLETGGLHPEPMRALRDLVDLVSMDIKLFSSSGLHNILPVHERFLESLGGTACYVKVVVNPGTTETEIAEAAMIVASKDPSIPFFIQPEARKEAAPGGTYLLALWEAARAWLEDVRIQPQIHRMLDLR